MRLIEEPYHTPAGSIDFPFCYAFDASALTDGADYFGLQLPLMNDSDFILRHVAGVTLCVDNPASGGLWNYRQPESQQNVFGNGASAVPFLGAVPSRNHTVVPEKYWPSGSAIYLDLVHVLRNSTICAEGTIYNSQIAFWGAKRLGENSGYRTGATPYQYKEKKYSYLFNLTIDWAHFDAAGVVQAPHRFWVQLDNMDFELVRIAVTDTTGTQGRGSITPLVANDFQIVLYDASLHATSNIPINQAFLNSVKPTPQTQPVYQPGLAPTIVYPGGGAITFDIVSMLCSASLTKTYNILFDGVWRIPC